MNLSTLRALGFTDSKRQGKHLKIACPSCTALTVNGIPCHETGCPEAKHECKGCNELIPRNQKYCADCA